MQLSCPACKKVNDCSQTATATCQRCGCDLSRLVRLRRFAAAQHASARQALAARDWQSALDLASYSWFLLHDAAVARTAALASCALGDHAQIRLWQARCRQSLSS